MKIFINIILLLTLVLAFGNNAASKNYVSLSGQFYVDVPDDWNKIGYRVVDKYLIDNNVTREGLFYDAVFAPQANKPFHNGVYMLITYERVGELNNEQIDSVLAILFSSFGEQISYFPIGDYMADLQSNQPVYDRDAKVATILNDVITGKENVKKNLLTYKFYNKGIAKFFFYAPDSLFEQNRGTFANVIKSFSDENIEEALPKEDSKVVDVESRTKSNITKYILALTFVMMIIVGIMATRKKRKREQQSQK